MRCAKCGKDNPGYTAFCGWCGSDLKETAGGAVRTQPEQRAADTPSAADTPVGEYAQPEMRYCSKCGTRIQANSYTCPNCGDYPWQAPTQRSTQTIWETDDSASESYTTPIHARPRSSTPVIGGIMSILAGVLALGQGLLYLAGSTLITFYGGTLCLCGGLDSLFGVIAIVGGISALKREGFAIALVGAILGMLGFGFLIGFVFGLIALVLIAISRQEFA